jgi:hypothetical protein
MITLNFAHVIFRIFKMTIADYLIMTQLPPDGGPIYAETNLERQITEPWNAISSLALVLPALYWMVRLKFDIKNYTFIYFSIPLLLAGGTGSLLYHASRTSWWLLYLDVLPTAVLTISVGVYFWWKFFKNWLQVSMIIIPATLLRIYLLVYHSSEASVNLSYFIAGVVIFLPVLLYLMRHNYHYLSTFVVSVTCLIISLILREADHWFAQFLPMGSHFLWHIFSGIGAYYLAYYLYKLRHEEINESKSD